MPIVPPAHMLTREAWLVYGKIASGKSSIWDTVADQYRRTGTSGKFHVMSTEPERVFVMLEQHTDWAENVVPYELERSYESLLATSKLIHSVGTKEDWIIIDSIGSCLDWVRNNWFEANLGKTWKQFQEAGGNPKQIEPHNWTQMNEMYKAWMLEYILGFQGHRMAVAQADSLAQITQSGGDWDKGHTRDTYGTIGFKPVGYRFDDYYFHSVWFANRTRDNKLTLKTVKDKPGRAWMDNDEMAILPVGFVGSYLVHPDRGGWTMD